MKTIYLVTDGKMFGQKRTNHHNYGSYVWMTAHITQASVCGSIKQAQQLKQRIEQLARHQLRAARRNLEHERSNKADRAYARAQIKRWGKMKLEIVPFSR